MRLLMLRTAVFFSAWLCLLAHAPAADKLPSVAELAATHGYVYLNDPKYVGAATNLFLSDDNDRTLKVQSVSDKRHYALTPRKDAGTDAYGLWLPAGDYKIVAWGRHEWGEYPAFTVEAGRITNLGSLIPVSIGANQFIILPIHRTDAPDRVSDAVAEFHDHLTAPAPIDWRPDKLPAPMKMSDSTPFQLGLVAAALMSYDHHVNKPPLNAQMLAAISIDQFLALAKTTMPPLRDVPVTDDQNNLYYGAALGQVRVRSSAGAWSSLDTGTWESITAVAWINHTLYAGALDGTVRTSSDGGSNWSKSTAFDFGDPVVGINRAGTQWLVVRQHETPGFRDMPTPRALTVLSSSSEGFGDFRPLKQWTLIDGVSVAWRGASPKAYGDYYYLNTFKELLRLDLKTGDWKSVTPPSEVDWLSISPGGGVLTAYLAKGMFSKVFESVDQGAAWTKRDAPPYIILDVYLDELTGVAERAHPHAFSVTLEKFVYDRKADHWTKTQEFPSGCIRLLHSTDHRQTFCVTNGNSILLNTETGLQAEFSVQ
jgi:hypothetical protein